MKEVYYDELTGCYNRRFLHYWIDNEIKRATRFATNFALILLDIDDFRNVNNNFGHLEGDKVLVNFSEFLERNIREVDNLVRYGGDEFIILMPNTDEKGSFELAQRIIDSLNEIEIINHKIHCSIGFSVFPRDGTTTEPLINQADNLMYQAKKQGKNRIGLKHEVIRKLQIPSPVTIGRDDETHWCVGELKDYNTVFVAGEAGIGKTRLVLEIKKSIKTPILLRGNAYAALSPVPYHPFKNMFHELINKDFTLVHRIFKQMPEIYQSEIMKIMPAESMLKVAQSESLDKYRLYNSVSEFLNQMAEFFSSDVTMVLIDDLHWLDRPSCEMLDFLIRSVKNNIKVFGTYRVEEIKGSPVSEFLGIWAREKLYTQITLSPLNRNQTLQLLKAIMGPSPQSAIKYIFEQSGGNPFYIEEILRELERRKKLYWSGREWSFAKSLEITIPTSIEETIKRKIKFIDAEIKEYIEIAAVFGQEFVTEIIAMASKRNVGQILDAIDELRRLGFIKERAADSFFFSEDIVRQIVYKNISRGDLMQYHKAVGETIEIMYRNILPNYYEQLATHFTIANDPHKALYYSKRAALKAKDNYAHSIAIKFFENALKFEDNIDEIFDIKFSLGEIYFLIGDFDSAIQQLNICLKINPNSYKVCEKLGNVYESMGDYKNSFKQYETGLEITQGTDAVYTFRAAIAWLYTRLGQYSRAQKECEDILKKKRQMSRQTLSDTYIILGVVYLRTGKFKMAEECLKKSLKIRQSIGDKKRIAACYLDLGLNNHQKFNIKLSVKFYNMALDIYEEIGHQEGILITFNNLGALYGSYDIPKAEAFYLKALKTAKLIGAKRTIVFLYNNLGAIEYNRLMKDQALLNYRQALKAAKEINFHTGVIFSNLSLSEYYRDARKIKKGKSHLEAALRVAKKLNIKYLNIDCLKEEIDYLLISRQLKKADALSRKMFDQLRTDRSVAYKIDSIVFRAKILVRLKQYKKAHSYYKKAFNYVKSLPANRIGGEIYYLMGVAYKGEGKLKEALEMFLEANRIFKAIGNLRFLDKIEQEIANTRI
jgi:diguanylate cyclase (GGDEF)-like protein